MLTEIRTTHLVMRVPGNLIVANALNYAACSWINAYNPPLTSQALANDEFHRTTECVCNQPLANRPPREDITHSVSNYIIHLAYLNGAVVVHYLHVIIFFPETVSCNLILWVVQVSSAVYNVTKVTQVSP